jgi:hypothetical protein
MTQLAIPEIVDVLASTHKGKPVNAVDGLFAIADAIEFAGLSGQVFGQRRRVHTLEAFDKKYKRE